MAISNRELMVGQTIKLKVGTEDGQEIMRDYRIIGLYTFHVLLLDEKTGVRRDISNAELYCMGILSGNYRVETPCLQW